jgi:hypothetical protein
MEVNEIAPITFEEARGDQGGNGVGPKLHKVRTYFPVLKEGLREEKELSI